MEYPDWEGLDDSIGPQTETMDAGVQATKVVEMVSGQTQTVPTMTRQAGIQATIMMDDKAVQTGGPVHQFLKVKLTRRETTTVGS